MQFPRKSQRVLMLAVGLVLVAALAWGGSAGAAITWGTIDQATPQNAWLWTGGQNQTDVSTDAGGPTTWTHLAYSSDTNNAGNVFPAYDCEPHVGEQHAGAYYTRSSDFGATWEFPRQRLTSANIHAERASVSADGQYVHAVYVSQACYYLNGTGKKPRVMYYRGSNNYGANGSWTAEFAVTNANGRVDYPNISAANGTVLVIWTNADTGVVNVTRSADNGGTWGTEPVGATKVEYAYYGPEGFRSYPTVAITPEGDAMAAFSKTTKDSNGDLFVRTSTDGGDTWGTAAKFARKGVLLNESFANSDAASNRIGLVWTTGSGLFYREYNGTTDTWGTKVKVAAPGSYADFEVAEVTLNGASQSAIAVGGCKLADCVKTKKQRIDMLYLESNDNGATWSAPSVVAKANDSGESLSTLQTWGSVVFNDSDTRTVIWNNWKHNYGVYNMWLKIGDGTPA